MKVLPVETDRKCRGCQSSARFHKPTTSCYKNVPRGHLGVSGWGSVCSSRVSHSRLLPSLPNALRFTAAQACSRPFSTPQRPEDPGDSGSRCLDKGGCQATSKHLASLNSLRLVAPKFDPGRPGQRCWLRRQASGAHSPPGRTRPRASPGTATRNRSREGRMVPGFPAGFRRTHPRFYTPATPPRLRSGASLASFWSLSGSQEHFRPRIPGSWEPARGLRPLPGT